MKISFQHQSVNETEKQYGESRTARGNRSAGKRNPGKTGAAGAAGPEGDIYAPGWDWGGISGNTAEKGKSLIELQREAQSADVGISQDYMTVMSHTLSEEDYAKGVEEGFDFGNMNPDETVTILDRIKAELVRAGKAIVGYTDTLDTDTLAAALGSQALAEAVRKSFQEADIPLTEENLEQTRAAWLMASQLQSPDSGSIRYLIDNEMGSEIWNLYLAENSGADRAAAGASGAARAGGAVDEALRDDRLARQIDAIIESSGRQVGEESRRDALWLLENNLPLTGENLDRLEELKGLEMPVTPERFAGAAADAIAEGKPPVYGSLSGKEENLYEKAVRAEDYYFSEEAWESCAGDVAARRQLEEIRLRMTAEVNIKLLKSGFSIDTAPMEKLVEALRQAERELAEQYFPSDAQATEKYRELQRTDRAVAELPGLPAQALGTFAEGQSTQTLEEFHRAGKALQEDYRKAGESYETLMTTPRRDLGDSMRKAFGNIDELLRDMGREASEENRRGVRILAYNRMELTPENLDRVLEADRQVKSVVDKLTPAATLKMIRDGINPLEKSFSELEEYFRELPEEYRAEAESYSRFLYGLERNHEITPAERESYIGIYRLVRQIEKGDGAAVGALVNAQAEVHFANLLSAVRSGRAKPVDVRLGERLGGVAELVRKGESISEQIGRAFAADVREILTEVSYQEEVEEEYNSRQLEQYRSAVARADQECAAMLSRGELSVGAENLLAAQSLLTDTEDILAFGKKRVEGLPAFSGEPGALDEGSGETDRLPGQSAETVEGDEELWELLDRPEEFERRYGEEVREALTRTEQATPEAESSLDVRRFQLAHKQLTVAGALARRQEFFLPMYVGESLTRVHLRLEQKEGGEGTVEISFRSEERKGLQAVFRFRDGELEGILRNDGQDEVMKTERIADIFKEEAGESWKVGTVSVVTGDVGFTAAGEGMDAETKNIELYRVAKVFLHAVQQGEMIDEN
ncbi:MAG: DUF6240 domain-containing protein [Roseburia sp.]|nr:DUF6240 domain-containing protein [Roseburia sp.]MCM1099234.1 DUF6240 domain-containing protein [Ruminococcus flavefaciens]